MLRPPLDSAAADLFVLLFNQPVRNCRCVVFSLMWPVAAGADQVNAALITVSLDNEMQKLNELHNRLDLYHSQVTRMARHKSEHVQVVPTRCICRENVWEKCCSAQAAVSGCLDFRRSQYWGGWTTGKKALSLVHMANKI